MAKKVAGTLKLQVKAGQATRPRPSDRLSVNAGSTSGILQGVQRQDAGDGSRFADSDRDYLLRRQELHIFEHGRPRRRST